VKNGYRERDKQIQVTLYKQARQDQLTGDELHLQLLRTMTRFKLDYYVKYSGVYTPSSLQG